jgi:hypothetical protein
MFRPRHLVLVSALALATPAIAAAEPQWGRPSGGYGYYDGGNGRVASRVGFETGLNDGYQAGLNDARGRRRYDFAGERRYRSGDRGYNRRFGSRDAYRADYRSGFREGYDRGFRDGDRYDNRRGGGFFEFRW